MPLKLRESLCRHRHLPRSDAVVMGRAELLQPEERELLEAVLVDGQRVRSVAGMMGVTPRSLRSRIHKIVCRLTSRSFLNAGRAMPYLSGRDREVARMRFCEGISQRRISRKLGMTEHALRRRLDRISAQIETILQICAAREGREDK